MFSEQPAVQTDGRALWSMNSDCFKDKKKKTNEHNRAVNPAEQQLKLQVHAKVILLEK